jgi:hypothetical protein
MILPPMAVAWVRELCGGSLASRTKETLSYELLLNDRACIGCGELFAAVAFRVHRIRFIVAFLA